MSDEMKVPDVEDAADAPVPTAEPAADTGQPGADPTDVIPKKIPAADDIAGQTAAVAGALASALLTATEMPLHMMQPVIGDLAAQLVAFGIRQTDQIDAAAVHAPAWITDGVRQQSMRVPEQMRHTEAKAFVERVSVAPPVPKRLAKHQCAVIECGGEV